jgi:Leucine-rich repeat (LRR) protein
MKSVRLVLFILVNAFLLSMTIRAFGGASTIQFSSNQIDAHIATEWEKRGVKSGWLCLDDLSESWQFQNGPRQGAPNIASLYISQWPGRALKEFPVPTAAFGLKVDIKSLSQDQLSEMGGFKNLEALDLGSVRLNAEGLKELTRLQKLLVLGLGYTTVADPELKLICSLEKLQWLSVGELRISDKGIEYLPQLKRLRSLVLRSVKNETELDSVGKLTQLESLKLGPSVADAGLKRLVRLKGLVALRLNGNSITDTGIVELSGMKRLRLLDLDNTMITDVGLNMLLKHVNLDVLSLAGTRITDASVAHLAGQKALRWLNLEDTLITEKGLDTLMNALPKAKIVH